MKGRIETIDVVRLIGTLDRCISEMLVMASNLEHYDLPDKQTLKHHAEDAIAAGQKVLKLLEGDENTTADPKTIHDQKVAQIAGCRSDWHRQEHVAGLSCPACGGLFWDNTFTKEAQT